MMINNKHREPSWATGFARSAAQSANPGLWDGLVGLWAPSLGPTGDTLYDVSGFENHGSLQNMDAGSDWVVGEKGWGLDFDGTEDYVLSSIDPVDFTRGTITVLMTSVGTGVQIFFDCSDNSSSNGIVFSRLGNLLLGQINNSIVCSASISFNPSTPQLLTFQWDNETGIYELYVDGKPQLADPGSDQTISDVARQITIGVRYAMDTFHYSGTILSVLLHNRALSPNEIQLLAQDNLILLRQRSKTFVVPSSSSPTNSMTLYLCGVATSNYETTLMTHGHSPLNSYLTTQITGHMVHEEETTLFVDGLGFWSRGANLFIEGTDTTVGHKMNLFIQVDSAVDSRAATLFIKNTQDFVAEDKSGFLFIEGAIATQSASAPLYIQNDAINNAMSLFIKAPGTSKDHIPFSRTAPLFINRPDESVAMTLFMKAVDNPVNAYASLYTRSALEDEKVMTLAMPNVASIPINSFSSLMIQGVEIASDDTLTLMTDGHGTLNNTMSLVVKQETVPLNSYINMYTMGAYLLPENMNLVMPNVHDESTLNSIPLYIFGW